MWKSQDTSGVGVIVSERFRDSIVSVKRFNDRELLTDEFVTSSSSPRTTAALYPACGTIDAIHAARLLVEKHRERQKLVHVAFLGLEKAFDRVPRELIWYALRRHNVPEELIEWVQMLYSCPKSRVFCRLPLLFVDAMDAITRDLQQPVPWTLLYADNEMLACDDKGLVQNLRTEFTGLPREFWPATKELETLLSVMETKMLGWTAGVTRMDRIRNDAIRQTFGVAPIADKMREARSRWYGDVLRGEEDSIRKIGLELEVSEKRLRGRPKQAARLEHGTTKPGRRKIDKQTWLWTDDVKAKVREKKSLYHVFLSEVNEKLESRHCERHLY
ncbi:unnamed protein product [Heligmosomoides polygyrus]|uniref:Reverse transcriptase domain-containing protein n=1 Tax=Heligmosomoides polygyrus TaxID=6339 RepID=A0A183FFG1_HELPZ|nr:unnamed protein product [Heligmosomoides polygyrus]